MTTRGAYRNRNSLPNNESGGRAFAVDTRERLFRVGLRSHVLGEEGESRGEVAEPQSRKGERE